MKKILFYLLLLFSTSASAQFPTTSLISVGEEQRRNIEGLQFQSNASGYNNTVATSQNGNTPNGDVARNTSLAGLTIQPTKTVYVEYVSVTNWGSVDVNINLNMSTAGFLPSGQLPYNATMVLKANSTQNVPVNAYKNEGTTFLLVANADLTGSFAVSFSVMGDLLPLDQNTATSKVMAVLGTSISNSTGPAYGKDFYHALVRDTYRNGLGYGGKRVNLRMVNIGNGGFTVANTVALIGRKQGNLLVETPSVIVVEMGMNDAVGWAAGGATRTAIQNNFQSIINWRNEKYKNVPLIICGSSPRQDAFEASGLVPMRAWISGTLIPAQSDPNIGYCDFRTNFDPSINSNYIASEQSGTNGIHPSAQGHLLMKTQLLAALAALNITF